MKYLLVTVFVLFAMNAQLRAGSPSPVVESERAFSKLAGEKGTRQAFLTFMAKDGVVFQQAPVLAQEVYEKRPESPAVLFWQPVVSEISTAGDLGYSTGPWEWKPKPEDKPVAFGQFVSIWKKQPDGTWKVAVDLGCSHGENSKPVAELMNYDVPVKPAGKSQGKTDPEQEENALLEADRRFSKDAAEKGTVTAYESWLVSDARFFRNGIEPVSTRSEMRAALEKNAEKLTWEPIAGGVAASGDLGYTYGTSLNAKADANEKGHYLRAWKRQADNSWKVALDIVVAIPQ